MPPIDKPNMMARWIVSNELVYTYVFTPLGTLTSKEFSFKNTPRSIPPNM